MHRQTLALGMSHIRVFNVGNHLQRLPISRTCGQFSTSTPPSEGGFVSSTYQISFVHFKIIIIKSVSFLICLYIYYSLIECSG